MVAILHRKRKGNMKGAVAILMDGYRSALLKLNNTQLNILCY